MLDPPMSRDTVVAREAAAIRHASGESRTLAASLPRLVLDARRIAATSPR